MKVYSGGRGGGFCLNFWTVVTIALMGTTTNCATSQYTVTLSPEMVATLSSVTPKALTSPSEPLTTTFPTSTSALVPTSSPGTTFPGISLATTPSSRGTSASTTNPSGVRVSPTSTGTTIPKTNVTSYVSAPGSTSTSPAPYSSLSPVLSSVASGNKTAAQAQMVKVSLFYETLCPYSMSFVRSQVLSTYLKLKGFVHFDLVPYGNAKTTKKPDGTYQFKCQHGSKECQGNMIHACAIAHIPDEGKLLPFIQCTFDKKKGFNKKGNRIEEPAKMCAKSQGIDFTPIATCVKGPEGMNLEAMYGNRTDSLVPPLDGVPWVLFNDVFFPQDRDAALHNLVKVVCQHYTGTKPSTCNSLIG